MFSFDEIYKETKEVSSKMNAIKDITSPEYDELFERRKLMNNELRDIAIALSKMQKDIRSIAEKLNSQTDDFIVQIKRYHDAGLTNSEIEKLLGIDFWMVTSIVDRYERDKEANNG